APPRARSRHACWTRIPCGRPPSVCRHAACGGRSAALEPRRRRTARMPAPDRLNFGMFLAPFHRIGDNPTYSLERDLELAQHLDRLGFDEAWFGEHHSAGYEIIAAPEGFVGGGAGGGDAS